MADCPPHLQPPANISHCVCIVQKRVVNVYRLITRGTLEEKIMGLQKFKMSIANTVISQDNASLQSMGTDQLLNLFTLDKVRSDSDRHTDQLQLQHACCNLIWIRCLLLKSDRTCKIQVNFIHTVYEY